MARSFRLWEKKRGEHRTGSRFLGSLGEALFFSALFLFGSVASIGLITLQLMHSTADQLYISGWGLWLRVLIILAFLMVGGVGFFYTVLHARSSRERRSARAAKTDKSGGRPVAGPRNEMPEVPSDENITNSPGTRLAYRLPIAHSSAWRFLLDTFICLVASSAASVLLMLAWESFSEGAIDWLALSFFLPAVGVGVAFAVRFVRDLTIHLTVGPTSVEISDHPLRPGSSYEVFFAQVGQMLLSRIRLTLICDEQATYREGTDVRIESMRVYEQDVLSRSNVRIRPAAPFELQGELQVPAGAMHSFQSTSNSVRWKLLVTLEPHKWPMIQRSFSVVIVPAEGKTVDGTLD